MATNILEGSEIADIGGFKPIDMDNPTCVFEADGPCNDVRCDECPFRVKAMIRSRVLYLDLDGVLADFDKLATEICGAEHHRFAFVYGDDVFWKRLNSYPNFFGSLELMSDAAILYNAVRHLKPVILTALPRDNPDRVAAEKAQWVYENVDKQAKVITCFTKDKPNYCQPGDVLVDDRAVNQAMWRRRGGHFVIHTSAENSINQLINLGVL